MPADPYPFLSFEPIMREPIPPVDWLVEPLISRGDRVMVYGEVGCGKSWLLLSLGLHLAAGRPWLGQFAAPQAQRVLYVDEEMGERRMRRRIHQLARGAGLGADQRLPFHILPRQGIRLDEEGAATFMERMGGLAPDVIIIETFRRVFAGDENLAKEVSAFWRDVDPVLHGGRTLIISHHMRKPHPNAHGGGDHARYRASGSTDITANADTVYALDRRAKDTLVMECTKLREAEEPEAFAVSRYDENGGVRLRYMGAVTQPDILKAEDFIEQFLRDASGQVAEPAAILAYLEGHKVSRRAGERALSRMKKERRLHQAKPRGPYSLVDAVGHDGQRGPSRP